ncbi:MAG: hypothetical protein JNJ83_11350 [Verrucomicrobiaceae bacterium]|nr:hypothetical protein [Verrucomicrobiaceae bacterium]
MDTARHSPVGSAQRVLLFKFWVGCLVLVPAFALSVMSFAELMHSGFRGGLTEDHAFRACYVGAFFWLLFVGIARKHLMIFYVFGHEWSHMLAALACRARIYDWSVGSDGGWVDTDRSNTFISLAPYFFPFYTVIACLLMGTAGLFVDLSAPIEVLGTQLSPMLLCLSAIGFTWCFHLTYTVQTLLAEQSDLLRNGEFFSMILIALLNVEVLRLLLVVFTPELTWAEALQSVVWAWDFSVGNILRVLAYIFMPPLR